jgi:hypothetical protein
MRSKLKCSIQMKTIKKYSHQEFTSEVSNCSISTIITSASFESRCFIIQDLTKPLSASRYVFYNSNEGDEIVSNANSIKQKFPDTHLIALDSDSPIDNYFKIDEALMGLPGSKNTLLIDSTTFTHETLLILLRILSLNKDEFHKIYFAYVGAGEYSYNTPSDEEKWLSKGVKEIRTILGYPGFTDPTHKNHLMIMVGFESERTKKLIQEYEYEYITLGFGDLEQSIQSNHYKINFDRHQKLMEEHPNAGRFNFCLTEPEQAKRDIMEYLKDPKLADLNTVIAPMNNKISTIGAGLAAIENENIQLAYAKPNIYNTSAYSKPNEDIYFFEISFKDDK